MASSRQIHRLNALRVAKEVAPGYHADGGGLYLQISSSGSRSWIFRYSLAKRAREMGLGPLSAISLAEARAEAARCRKLLGASIDPIEDRRERERAAQATPDGLLFRNAARDYIDAHRGSWKNAKHAQQWENTLDTYAYPAIGDVDVRDIDTAMIVRVLQPIWTNKAETASRVRGRIECVLDAAKVLGKRSGENPARWRGHLDKILPKRDRSKRVKHHPALPWADIPEFMPKLAQRMAPAARVLHLLILTCVRTTEALEAKPEEFDLDRRIWTVPPDRMKMEKELRVPLSEQVVQIVKEALKTADGYLFPGQKRGKPLSNMAMLNMLDRMGYEGITVHGFRSTFRDWVAECTEYSDSLAEMALAHAVESKVEGAYRRGDMLERRRRMMEDWARYCSGQTGVVVPIKREVTAA
ncbi:integrase arm-type DNA-binding domain-containing protein [Ralstonia solanacearum]|uniref:tyrosine-type recombinase/integrase n=1 Tax=Ralstonia solanacearum TaxID=305 RepID=UPI0005C4A6E9|nr:integrase arm-type DNA-binding domain-containing protein [Ralstonia solanacearum]MBB6590990.1 integrase arm-type DNA-binding domain-containing protein [Ralstonia solanacearum]MBB6595185.1 integrase arm-type DNA-binding domain-containing protein [Ralstonia solanacearum]MDB0541049.1 integrase arm-type DNA-binding domain-containing protein [Ralstonia solanacearum]MDB0551568.1 integrase arm-type DNA-binding domain-containing protein [Ralstonia solanacearum]MDB0555933.1 integrase arm-type DNA-bi